MALGDGASMWAKVDEGNYRRVVEKLPGKFASLKETLRANYDDVLEELRDEALRLAMASEVPRTSPAPFVQQGNVPLVDTRGQSGAAPPQPPTDTQRFRLYNTLDEEIPFQEDPAAHWKCQHFLAQGCASPIGSVHSFAHTIESVPTPQQPMSPLA